MTTSRKRNVRLVVALTVAALLAGALIYTSFTASTQAEQPSRLLKTAKPGRSYELTGVVVANSVKRHGNLLLFSLRDRKDSRSAKLPVRYTGAVPDPFREGREVIVQGKLSNGVFVGERDSLVTKCPSKFAKKRSS